MQNWDEILAFCGSGALGCMDEPPIYGPLRLIDCLESLIQFGQENGLTHDDRLEKLADYIEENKLSCMYDEEGFRRALEEIVMRLLDITEKKD